ncbi:MAG: hypothetical protein U1F68_08595 [Gammaproteobacteria bacterium]
MHSTSARRRKCLALADLVVAARYRQACDGGAIRGFGVALVELDNPSTLAASHYPNSRFGRRAGRWWQWRSGDRRCMDRCVARRARASFWAALLTAIYQADGFTVAMVASPMICSPGQAR